VDSRVIKNHIALKVVKWLGLPYRKKLESYALVIILEKLVLYKDKIINLEIGPV
jgi:hypothetical protein